jgi:EmrB/QacA subfamily drug resistance transporter
MLLAATRRKNYKWWAFGAITIGTFSSVVDYGSVNIALPSIANHFSADIPTVQWVVIGFTLTISALLLPMGRLADLMGLKRVYLWGSLALIVGAALAGASADLAILILSRIIQGCGAAMTQGTGMAIVISAFPGSERGKAIGFMMTTVGVGAIAGPALGGFLVDVLGWRSVFFANIPVVALGAALGLVILDGRQEGRNNSENRQQGFDWLGAALSTGALLVFLLTITNGHRVGWSSPPIAGAALIFIILLVAFIWWELRCSSPMLDLRFFQRRTFSFAVSAAFLTFLGTSEVLFLTPFYLQRVLGYSPREAGLVVVPGAICMALLGPLSGRLSDHYGWRPFTIGGLALSTTGLLILSRLTEGSSLLLVLPALILHSSGMGVFYSPNSSSILSTVERESYGIVSALLNLVRNAGNVTSVAVATAIVTATMGAMGFEPSLNAVQNGGAPGVSQAFTSGLRVAYLVMAGLTLLAMALSAFRFGLVKELKPAPNP